MIFFLTIILMLLQLASSMPTPAVATPRSCTTITPKSLQPLDNTWPNLQHQRSIAHTNSNLIIMHNNLDATYPTHTLQLIEFEVPPHSTTCQLHLTDPACSLSLTNSSSPSHTATYGPIQLHVTSLRQNSIPNPRSYNDIFLSQPSIVSSWEWGTVTMSQGDEGKVVNSEACPPMVLGRNGWVHYVLDYRGGTEGGGENGQGGFGEFRMLQQDEDVKGGKVLNGVYLTYC